ncbi:glutamine amidotransferase [Gregarina niphandrodes]|uniref:glutaminase n=1 Tax=Gregarina niphandrodes TaxID=110365 RepID=A0A023BCL0_GRENI|nr:glutamine amidotransferase [Gregarina niphandrodes]EZG83733.1 glutamine amidotransferase [Gregarina niphandrodes]|eukprot:XP_011128911.1 glutamine amidotransferase [Gregarina niphandrodes]
MRIGILALQGAFQEHAVLLEEAYRQLRARGGTVIALEVVEVRTPSELASCDALVIPGGESTTFGIVAERNGLLDDLRRFVRDGSKSVWGTCAGLIVLADQISGGKSDGQPLIGGLGVRVCRNHFGRQTESFIAPVSMPFLSDEPQRPLESVFIRAPVVDVILADDYKANDPKSAPVEVLGRLLSGEIIAVRQGHLVGTSFHPELTTDARFHKWWLETCVLGLTAR